MQAGLAAWQARRQEVEGRDEALEARRKHVRRESFIDGVKAVVPTLVASGTWGLVTGVALVKSGLSEWAATWMTVLVYAGSAQLLSLPMIAAGEPLLLILAAALMVNLRFVIFAAALHPYFRHLPWRQRLFLGYFTTDLTFVVFMSRYGKEAPSRQREQVWFYIGMMVPAWFNWQFFSLIGVFLGAIIPSDWSLEFAAVLALLAILVPLVRTRPMAVTVAVAAAVAWVGQNWPLRLGLAVAVVAGIVAGILAENRLNRGAGRVKEQ